MKTLTPIRVVAIIEAATVTGPAKNLIAFASKAPPEAQLSLVTYVRGRLDRPGPFVEAARAAGVEVDLVEEKGRFDRAAMARLREVVAARKPDLVQTHNVKSHFLFKMAGLPRDYRWIGFHHGYTLPDLKQRLYDQLDRWTLPSTRLLITVCKPFAEDMLRIGVPAERIRVLHNSVTVPETPDAAVVGELRRSLGVGDGEQLVLVVGRLSFEKGHADLLRAFVQCPRSARLLVLGDGPERSRLEAQAVALGVKDRVIFAGHVGNVRPYYFASDVLALPSHTEGSPNVVLEAMAMGLPVVAAAVGGVPEIVSHEETGLMAPARDPEAFGKMLNRMLSDPGGAQKMAARGLELVRSSFTPEEYRRKLLEIYRSVLAY